ncbi:MAG TPA: putative lipid II flippase FtsW [bacterium]|nr:putative lipid II flippase FtsW [bacterium]
MKNRIHFDVMLLLVVMLLVVIGIVAVYSASSYIAQEGKSANSQYYLYQHLIRVVLGIVLMALFINIDYHLLQKLSPAILAFAFLLLLYVLIKGEVILGSRRSFSINGISFQPSEMAKYALVLFLSIFLIEKDKQIKEFNEGLLPVLLIVGLVLFPILLEPDMGSAAIIFIISIVMIFIAGASLYHLASLGAIAMVTVSVFLKIFPYQKSRVASFFNAIRGVEEPVYQVKQSLISFGNGGFWGVGLGNSRQKMHFLPHPFNDFIYSIIGEETGMIGCLVVLLLFMVFLWRGLWIAVHAPDKQGQLLAIGITASIVIYALINAGIALNLLPVTGITMPFISYGGSSMIMNFIALGVLLNISIPHKRNARSALLFSQQKIAASRAKYRKKRIG